jgi:uncharacterized membrane protein
MRHRQAIALLALVGLFISLYLWLYKIGWLGALKCGSGACEFVQTSRYATLLGQPVALYGMVGYLALFVIALVGLQPRFLPHPGPTRLLAAGSCAGFAFTVYLTYLELFVIHAVCRWCVASAVIIAAIAGIAVPVALRTPAPRTDP